MSVKIRVNTSKYKGFCVCRRSYLLWSPVIVERYNVQLCGHKSTPQRYYVATYQVCSKHSSGQCNVIPSYILDTRCTAYTLSELKKRMTRKKETNRIRENEKKGKPNCRAPRQGVLRYQETCRATQNARCQGCRVECYTLKPSIYQRTYGIHKNLNI